MVHKLRLKNFKRIKEEIFEFRNFDLIVGSNNSGKSTALQAMAIWQFCVDQFLISNRRGSRGIQVVLPILQHFRYLNSIYYGQIDCHRLEKIMFI